MGFDYQNYWRCWIDNGVIWIEQIHHRQYWCRTVVLCQHYLLTRLWTNGKFERVELRVGVRRACGEKYRQKKQKVAHIEIYALQSIFARNSTLGILHIIAASAVQHSY